MGPFQLILITFLLFWILPLILGLNLAPKKGITRKWMLFAIHPFSAWIGYLIISLKRPKRPCPNCDKKIDTEAKVCSYCMEEIEPLSSPKQNNLIHTILAILIGLSIVVGFLVFGFNLYEKGLRG